MILTSWWLILATSTTGSFDGNYLVNLFTGETIWLNDSAIWIREWNYFSAEVKALFSGKLSDIATSTDKNTESYNNKGKLAFMVIYSILTFC